eukprot:CAMPEP_0113318620 /NCGR_PEP_ID=MMETSP0010_2-20120614/13122_1 /TAXON_ID=216773 ORGANISM="Corethron hystrix, Strain 308" /NCGR_SAMPLE_ID=MMETSP0010_2 /ASSEMBLY_ACC=CAM_ASM_000155 /LENGTH=407 /DNA_ID=CAMNT_0000175971 /DNA_START=214 /DNA_END=1435 /DNA_ORIENTATION=+ /assembly_acc=CAM_ASM_000155
MDFSFDMFKAVPSLVREHYRNGAINWPMGIYVTLVHIAAAIGISRVTVVSKETLMWAFILWPISGFGITVGVHRLWSHRSYEAAFPVRLILMLANSIANQGSIYHWARDHRVHHKFSETDADPHNATRGFFFAHMGWLFVKKHPAVIAAGRELDFSDLLEDSCVMFQKKMDPWFALYMCYVMPAQVAVHWWGEDFWNAIGWGKDADPHNATRGFFFAHMGWLFVKKHPAVIAAGRELDFSDLLEDSCVMFQKKLDPWFTLYMCYVMPAQVAVHWWGEDFWNAMWVAGALRYAAVLHFTWLVNSAAHLMGDHPYDVLSYPAENPFVSFFAVGEGWHNWHHKYPFDYSASEFGVSSQFNPSRLLIDMFAWIGLVWNRKSANAAWKAGKQRRDKNMANGIKLPKAPPRPW